MATFPIYTLTPDAAASVLRDDGINTLGLTTLALSPQWSGSSVSYDSATLRLTIAGSLQAPFRGLLSGVFAPASSTLKQNINADDVTLTVQDNEGNSFPAPTTGSVILTLSNESGTKRETVACTARSGDVLTVTRGFDGTKKESFSSGDKVTLQLARGTSVAQFTGADGQPILKAGAVYRLHPQAILRLERLMSVRFSNPSGSALIYPVPWSMLIHEGEFFQTDQFFEPNTALPVTGSISFHDSRGLIVDPIYVASLFDALLTWLPGLKPNAVAGSVTDAGGVRTISQIATSTLVHVVNPHGGNFQSVTSSARLIRANSGGTSMGDIPGTSLVELGAGERVQAHADDDAENQRRLRWGWATNGTMSRTALTPPDLPSGVTLSRKFFRVCAADIRWAILGNRTGSTVLGIQKDDERIPSSLLPEVRDQVDIDYLADGLDTLAESVRVLQRPNQSMIMAVSQQFDRNMLVPSTIGDNAHWPAFPAVTGTAVDTVPNSIPSGSMTAAFVAAPSNDVVVTLSGVVPEEAHVRIYPSEFVAIPAITEEPSFVRGDGGAAIAKGATVEVLLPNPFRIVSGGARPSSPSLTFDLVITPRAGNRRLYGAQRVDVSNGPATPPSSVFSGASPLTPMLDQTLGIGPSPLFGIAMPPEPSTPSISNPVDLALSLAAETSPRQAPRLPTQARFETMIVTGTTGPGTPAPANTLLWDAVVTGARWIPESRSAQHAQGNPGNPAGPDVHAPGVHVSGALAYDVAMATARRVQPMIPWPTTDSLQPGWVVGTAGNNFNSPDDSANTTETGVGALLRTVAKGCETSTLSMFDTPVEGLTVQQMLNDVASHLGLSAPTFTIQNEARIQREIRREFFIAKQGLRDAQWSLLRALSEARELIYIESPQFAPTARPQTPARNFEVDLVNVIAERMRAHPNLHVIICTPRLSDYAANFKAFSRYHYNARSEAVSMLQSAASDRVAVFHPVGFPGRPAYIRTTSVIVDDVWSLVGTAHFRRRGMTFDGSVSIASFDREFQDGYSRKVREYRRRLMAAKMNVPAPIVSEQVSGDWIRLGRPLSAFALVSDWLAQGGLGRIQPLWPGPSDTTIMAAQPDAADPDGSTDDLFMTTLAGLLNELGD